jgi:nucleoside-specific outer membrane channel protein Tsx
MSKLQGNAKIIYSDFDDDLGDITNEATDSEPLDAAENSSHTVVPEDAWWLEPEVADPFGSRKIQPATTREIDQSHEFEIEIRQHIFDLLQYVDSLERQVRTSYRAKIQHSIQPTLY